MTSARIRKKRQARKQAPSSPRVIGANDNVSVANDNLPPVEIAGVTLNGEQARRFRAAAEQQASADRIQQGAGHKTMVQLKVEIDAIVAANSVKRDLAETQALETMRGAEIEVSDKQETAGRLHIKTRDGLETLSTVRKRKDGRTIPPLLTRIQYAAGLRYRHDYEMLDPERKLTPPSPDRIAGPMHGGEGWETKRLEIERRLWTIHLMIAGVEVREGQHSAMPALPDRHPARRAIHVLGEVAGKGTNLWNLSTSGSVRFRNSEALKWALDCAAIVYGLE